MAKTDTHDWNLRGVHQFAQVVDGLLAVSWITGTVGNENTVEVVSDLVDGIVVRQAGDAGAAADEAAEDVLLDTTVDDGNVEVAMSAFDVEGRLGADLADEVDLFGVDERFILVCIVFLANGDPGKRRTLLAKVGDNCTSINSRDCRYTLPSAPFAQAFNSCPMAVMLRNIGHDNTSSLQVRRFEILEQALFASS